VNGKVVGSVSLPLFFLDSVEGFCRILFVWVKGRRGILKNFTFFTKFRGKLLKNRRKNVIIKRKR